MGERSGCRGREGCGLAGVGRAQDLQEGWARVNGTPQKDRQVAWLTILQIRKRAVTRQLIEEVVDGDQ